MKLYEVNEQLADLITRLEPDPETGEIPADEDEIIAKINALALERRDILGFLARMALNTKSDVEALKEEESRLQKRRRSLESRQARLIGILDRECDGQKTDLGVATLCYRRSSRVEILDEAKTLAWLDANSHQDCYRLPPAEISKSALSKLLDSGEKIPGAEKVSSVSCYLR